jgi:hypothetical protein
MSKAEFQIDISVRNCDVQAEQCIRVKVVENINLSFEMHNNVRNFRSGLVHPQGYTWPSLHTDQVHQCHVFLQVYTSLYIASYLTQNMNLTFPLSLVYIRRIGQHAMVSVRIRD